MSPLRDPAERRQLLRDRVGRVLLRPLSGRGEEPRRGHDGKQENRRRLVSHDVIGLFKSHDVIGLFKSRDVIGLFVGHLKTLLGSNLVNFLI